MLEPKICAVEPQVLDWFWSRRVGQWVADALERSVQHELSLDEVYQGCKDGTYQLLVTAVGDELAGCAVVGASHDPTGRPYLALICCSGERVEEWLSLMVTTCKLLAREIGAREIVVLGRPGWRALLQPYGCRLRAVVMVLDLEQGAEHG